MFFRVLLQLNLSCQPQMLPGSHSNKNALVPEQPWFLGCTGGVLRAAYRSSGCRAYSLTKFRTRWNTGKAMGSLQALEHSINLMCSDHFWGDQ